MSYESKVLEIFPDAICVPRSGKKKWRIVIRGKFDKPSLGNGLSKNDAWKLAYKNIKPNNR